MIDTYKLLNNSKELHLVPGPYALLVRFLIDIDKEIAEINMCKDDLGKKFENLIMYDDIKTLAEGLKEVAR